MPAAATYILKSATFKSVAIDGLEDVKFVQEGSSVSHSTDGQAVISATFIDDIKGMITVTSRNTGLLSGSTLDIGATGALVVVFQKRAAGKGAVAGQDKTLTAAEATLIKPGGNAPHHDRGSMDLEFECASAAGTAPFVWT